MNARLLPAVAAVCGLLTALPAAQTNYGPWQDVIRNLRHPEFEARLDALDRLAKAAFAPAADPVAMLLADPDDRVQAAAIEAELTFFLIENPGGTRLLGVGGSKSRAQAAFEAGPLVRSALPAPPAVIDRLIIAMRDDNPRIRFDAVHALGLIAQPPLPAGPLQALAAELDHYDPVIRAATARVLGRLRARDAGTALLTSLEDSSLLVRGFALEALGLAGDARAATSARAIAATARGATADAALLALARIGSRDDVELFRQRLTDRSASVRRAAVEGLGRAGDAASIPQIEQLFTTDRSPGVRLAAAFALQRLGQTQTHVIASRVAVRDEAAQARDYLLELGPAALPGVRAALETPADARHRADLLHLVGYLGSRADVPLLDGLRQDRDERVRRAAANAAARLQP
jgi:HEAT repeat protein